MVVSGEQESQGHDPSDRLTELAREKYGAEWVILCDTDEFLTVAEGDLRAFSSGRNRTTYPL